MSKNETNLVFSLSVPSTSFLNSANFKVLDGRKCVIQYSYELEEDSKIVIEKLLFFGVESYKCTYYKSCSLEMLSAYDNILEIKGSNWLTNITENLVNAKKKVINLKHFRIYFDDGPCFEFICESFELVREQFSALDSHKTI